MGLPINIFSGAGEDVGTGVGVVTGDDVVVIGIFMPGMFICIGSGDAAGFGVGEGTGLPISMPGIASISFFSGSACFFFCGVGFGLGLGFDLLMSMPDMSCWPKACAVEK